MSDSTTCITCKGPAPADAAYYGGECPNCFAQPIAKGDPLTHAERVRFAQEQTYMVDDGNWGETVLFNVHIPNLERAFNTSMFTSEADAFAEWIWDALLSGNDFPAELLISASFVMWGPSLGIVA